MDRRETWIKEAPFPLGCYDCGLKYGSASWIDTSIPEREWLAISPTGTHGGVLCIGCMSARLQELQMSDVPIWLTSGPFSHWSDSVLHRDAYEAGRRHEREGFPASRRERGAIDHLATILPTAGTARDLREAVRRAVQEYQMQHV